MFAAVEFQDETQYYKGALGEKVGTADAEKPRERDWTAGLSVYDISNPEEPRQISFMPVEGGGIHRLWYTGGRWAYASVLLDGFTDYIFMTIDMADPTHPREAGRYWLPGMNTAAGETPDWDSTRRIGLHHAIIHGDTAYGAWRDAGLVMMDVSDRTEPTLITHRNWSPPFGGAKTVLSLFGCSTSVSPRTRSAFRHSQPHAKRITRTKGRISGHTTFTKTAPMG
jgi:hypothetical protein